MAYLLITDFISGLDTRKSRFTAAPGSLRVARNVHLTRGGEIEVRKKFVTVYQLPIGQTKGLTTVRGQIYVFGHAAGVSVPAGVNYQQLAAPGGPALSRILSTDNFNGKIYVVAAFADGAIYHFYDGVRVTDWDAIANSVASAITLAAALAQRVDALDDFTALSTNNVIVVTGPLGVVFTYAASVVNGGTDNTQSFTPALATAAVGHADAIAATCSFTITGGTASPGVNRVTQVVVGGSNLLGAPVDWTSSNNATAALIAARINAFNPSQRWTATVSGATVTLKSEQTGAAMNGLIVNVFSGGDVTATVVSPSAGGANEVLARAQVVTFTIGGLFEALDVYTITLNGVNTTMRGSAAGTGTFVRTLGQKMYATNQSLMHFSGFAGDPAVPDPTQWDTDTTGAGFVNMSTQDGGSADLTGLAIYQNRMAVFSRRNVQIWSVDADEANNKQEQVLMNLGTRAPRTLAAFGDIDVFFLSESGVRSLRARDSSNMASADDVGSPIDGELLAYMRQLDESVVQQAVAISEPFEGRYLLAMGHTIYVFSHFPGAKVNAWTTYTLEELGDQSVVSDWAVNYTNLIARVGDQLCYYGGVSGDEYAEDGEFQYTVTLPFLDAGNPGQTKNFEGVDIGAEGYWNVFMALDPQQPDVIELVAKMEGSTYGSFGRDVVVGQSTHFSLTLRHLARGYARLANLMVHFTGQGD